METLIKMIRELVSKAFYGTLVVKFEAGRIVMIEKTEKVKP